MKANVLFVLLVCAVLLASILQMENNINGKGAGILAFGTYFSYLPVCLERRLSNNINNGQC